MRVTYVLDEGLACPCQTGAGLDTVASLQSAVKYLVKTKEVLAATVDQIEVYPPGVTIDNFRERTPLKPEDKLPKDSSKTNYIFVHAPRDYQDLTPEERKLYADPNYKPDESSPPKPTKPRARSKSPKKMARPPATQLNMNRPRSKSPMNRPRSKSPTPEHRAAAAAKRKKEAEEEGKRKAAAEDEARRKAEEEKRKAEEEARRKKQAEEEAARRKKEEEERRAKEAAAAAAKKKAEEEAERAKRRAAKKKEEEEDVEAEGWKVDPIKHDFTPTPMNLSTQRCWYQLEGDFVPYYLRFNGWEKGNDLKQHILNTRRSGRNAALLEKVGDDLSDLKLIPPGVDPTNSGGKEIGTDDVLPTGTTESNPILVIVKESIGQGRTLTPLGL